MKNQEHQLGFGNKVGWEVLLFFALYVISPTYFACEISEKLPLLTFSRFLLLLVCVMCLIRRRKDLFQGKRLNWQSWNLGLTNEKILRYGVAGYFLLLLICDLALIPQDFAEGIKAVFVLISEELLLVWILTLVLDTREKLLSALKVLVYASGMVGFIAAVGCIFERNPFDLLNTVQRDIQFTGELRLGMLRATAGFGHPVYYGAFCAVILPLHMYFMEHSEKSGEKVLLTMCMSMNIVGLVLANARGAILALGCLVIFAVIKSIVLGEFKQFCCRYLPVAVFAIAVLVVVSALSPVGIKFLWGYLYSLIRIVFPQLGIETLESAGMEYGVNAAGVFSRKAQLSGIAYTLRNRPIFGFGANAHVRGLIAYEIKPGEWWTIGSVDVGIVSVICQYGIIGFFGYMLLYGSTLCSVFRFHKDRLMSALGASFVIYLICLLTISSLSKMVWVLIAAIVCLTGILLKERKYTESACV